MNPSFTGAENPQYLQTIPYTSTHFPVTNPDKDNRVLSHYHIEMSPNPCTVLSRWYMELFFILPVSECVFFSVLRFTEEAVLWPVAIIQVVSSISVEVLEHLIWPVNPFGRLQVNIKYKIVVIFVLKSHLGSFNGSYQCNGHVVVWRNIMLSINYHNLYFEKMNVGFQLTVAFRFVI